MLNIRSIKDISYSKENDMLRYELLDGEMISIKIDTIEIAKSLNYSIERRGSYFIDGNSESWDGEVFINGTLIEDFEFSNDDLKKYVCNNCIFLTGKQAYTYLNISKSHWYNHVSKLIKRYKPYGQYRYNIKDLDEFVKKKTIQPAALIA